MIILGTRSNGGEWGQEWNRTGGNRVGNGIGWRGGIKGGASSNGPTFCSNVPRLLASDKECGQVRCMGKESPSRAEISGRELLSSTVLPLFLPYFLLF